MAIFMTMSLTVLFSVMGLSVDLGYSYYVKLEAQTAADAAATAAAIWANKNGYLCGSGVTCNSTYSCPTNLTSASTPLQAGCLYAQSNGFLNTGNQTVSLIANNTSVGGASPALWVQANTSQTLSHWFLFMLGSSSGTVAAQSVAGVTATPTPSCIYVLDSGSTQDAMIVQGTAQTSAGCGVWVNSSHPTKALEVTGNSKLVASKINVHGGVTLGNNTTVTPTPITSSGTVTDPFLSIPAPSVSTTCYKNGYSLTSGNDTISPGPSNEPYCGGITVNGQVHLTMNSGTYILNGGGFNISGGATITGSNVTIFLTGQNGQTSAPMLIAGGTTLTLSAPTGGTYQGILFYQDRNATYATANLLAGNSVDNISGTFYFPGTTLDVTGTIGASTIGLVVKDLSVAGTATFTQDINGTVTGLAKRSTSLIQ